MLVAFASLVPGPADAQPAHRIVIVRDAETEHPIRRLAHPLFHTAGVDPALVRITLIQDRAINAFVSTGNRLSLHSGLIQSAGELAGGHPGRLPDQMRAAAKGALPPAHSGSARAALRRSPRPRTCRGRGTEER